MTGATPGALCQDRALTTRRTRNHPCWMLRPRALLGFLCVGAVAAVFACGGDDDGGDRPDARPIGDDLAGALGELPHVVSVEERIPSFEGYRYFYIGFDQPVNHDDPDGQHFTQYLTLTHIDQHAPLILGTTGYGNYYGDFPMEPTLLLSGNQIIIEHRYFEPSRPDPTDWSFLRVAESAADHHEIAESFHSIYDGRWISTGGSKGGMTSIYHRHLYPDDVDGTVAYVAPYNQAAGDTRYDAWFDDVLPADCLQRVRDAQVDLLENRREGLVELATAQAEDDGLVYSRVTIPAAVESAVAGIEWSFFQYTGVSGCEDIPGPSATDEEAFAWLVAINPPDSESDDQLAFFEPYYYQAYAELGFPTTTDPHLEGLLQFGPEDYAGTEPPEIPEYDPSEVDAAAEWVRTDGDQLLFLYGEFDPWTAGAFDLGSNDGATRYTVAQGTHQSALVDLPQDEQDAAFALLEDWSGVAPTIAPLAALWRFARPREPRPPLHAFAMARRARAERR